MPADQPIVPRRFVKESRSEWDRVCLKKATRDREQARIVSNLVNDWTTHQVPRTGATALEHVRLHGLGDAIDLRSSQYLRHDFETKDVVLDRVGQADPGLRIP